MGQSLSWRVLIGMEMVPLEPVNLEQRTEVNRVVSDLRDKSATHAGGNDREPWDIAIFKEVAFQAFSCPLKERRSAAWDTYYRVFVGNGAAFERGKRFKYKDFTDGLENTIFVVEAGESVPWPKPDELNYDPAKPLPKFGGSFSDGFYAGFGDGKVRFIKNGTDEKLIRAMITRNGGEPIPELPPQVDSDALWKTAGYKSNWK